jgi:YVTN family beta-propeller protein
MFRLLRLALIAAALALWAAPHAPAIAARSVPPVVGLVLNEDGNAITVIDPTTYHIVKQHDFTGILNKPHLAAYDSGSRRLYVGNKGSNLAVFDVSDVLAPKLLANVKPGGDGEIHRLAIAEGMVWLAHEGDSAVYGYDLNLNSASVPKVVLGKEQGFNKTHGLRLRPGTGHGELWATNRPQDAPGSVLRIDAQTHAVIGQPLQTTGVAGDRPNNVEFTPDGRWAYVVNTGVKATKVTIIDATKFEVVAQIEQDTTLGLAPHAITYDRQAQRMFVVNKDSPTVSVIDVNTNTVIRYIMVGAEPHGITIGPDGHVWAVAKKGNKIAVIDPRSLTVTAEITDAALVGPHSMVWVKTNPRASQQGEDAAPVAFAETGYNLTGQFLSFWRASGGVPVLGYPISPIRAANGAISQWFERGQLELHPDNAAPYTLELARIGVEALAQEGIDWHALPSVDTAPRGCRYFAVTHHTLCGDFLAYWRGHGLKLEDRGISESESLALFGYPISEPQMERTSSGDTILTQWFERARFELHPNTPAGSRVLLGRLGAELQAQQALTSNGGIMWATTADANAASHFAYYCD